MNCTTIVKMASYSAAHLDIIGYFAPDVYSRHFNNSDGFLTTHVGRSAEQQPTQCSLLEGLPYEILGMILEVMDLKSFWAFASVNRYLRASICSLWVICDTQKSFAVSYALRRLIKADTGKVFTIADFEATLRSKKCTICCLEKEFAPFLNLATCQRICYACGKFGQALPPKEIVRLPYLNSSSNTVQVNYGRVCEGCRRNRERDFGSARTAWTRYERAYLEDQFLEHFNKCETAWEIAAGQRMSVQKEWSLRRELQLKVQRIWDEEDQRTQPASSICAAIRALEHADLTLEAYMAEHERLERILSEAKAQKMMKLSREGIKMLPELGTQRMEAGFCFTLETCMKQLG
jgi:hypothetical protein